MTTHSHKGFFISLVFGLVIGFVLGCWLCNREQSAVTNTSSVIDTIRYYKPIPYKPNQVAINNSALPRLLFAPTDTLVKTIIETDKGDSIEVSFPIEQREYKDSTYYAVVSGAVVGDRRPSLDYIETYSKTTTSEVVLQPKRLRPYIGCSVGIFGTWSIGVGGGVLIKDHHAVGAEYEKTQMDNRIKLKYSYLF